MDRIAPPNYTQVPNIILDNMQEFGDAELRVILCVCRQTFGWQRRESKNSLSSSFIATATGMSQQGVINATKKLLVRGVLARTKLGESFVYEVNVLAVELPQGPNAVETPPQRRLGVPLNAVETPPLNGVETNKERGINKGKEKEAPCRDASCSRPEPELLVLLPDPPPKSDFKAFTDGWCAMFREQFKVDYLFSKTKDPQAVNRLLNVDKVPNLLDTLRRAWALAKRDPKAWNCVNRTSDIACFASAFNKIHGELQAARNANAFTAR